MATTLGLPLAWTPKSMAASRPTVEEALARQREAHEKGLRAFPFERVESPGERAFIAWEELKVSGRGVPVVFGSEDTVATLADPFAYPISNRSFADIIKTADAIRYPGDFVARRKSEAIEGTAQALKMLQDNPNLPLPIVNGVPMTRDEFIAGLTQEREPKLGEWPAVASPMPELSVAIDFQTGQPLSTVQIGLIPTDDWTTVPAHMHWGGWNACPQPEDHVAAFRSWRDRYGTELVGLSGDTLNLRVRRRPATRAEALELAREQYLYCNDIIDQGAGTLSELAASLMASDWWFFWWD
jgi:hypothetical protein